MTEEAKHVADAPGAGAEDNSDDAVSGSTDAETQATSAEQAQFEFETSEREISFQLSETVYPDDAVYGACYLFIDRCYVFLTRPAPATIGVRLRTRGAADEEQLVSLAGEFANELLNQVLRHRIGKSTQRIREYYMARAFHAGTRSTLDDLLAELDDEELAEDDLEIAVPWDKADAG